MPRLEFPYQFDTQYRNWYPVIPLRLHGRAGRGLEASAYLDSGAAFSIFRVTEALSLGLDLAAGKPRLAIAGDGRPLHCFLFQVPVEVGTYRFRATVGFSPDLKVGFNILGLSGFFDHFREVAFQHARRRVVLFPSA